MDEKATESVETLASLRARAEQDVSQHQRRIERLTAALGQTSWPD